MVQAFLGHLRRPITQLLSPLPDVPTSSQLPQAPQNPALDLGPPNPWLIALSRSAFELAKQGSSWTSSLPVVSQLTASLRGSTQAFGAMCESFTRTAALLGVSEDIVVEKLKLLSQPPKYCQPSSAVELEELRQKMQTVISRYERRLADGIDRWREAENKAASLANSARAEISSLRQMLTDERRANSDLLLALEALRPLNANFPTLESFLQGVLPKYQKAAYSEAKGRLLKKIREKYPEADMDYFVDEEITPPGADLPPAWLEAPEGRFAYVSSFSAPPILLNKRRRLC